MAPLEGLPLYVDDSLPTDKPSCPEKPSLSDESSLSDVPSHSRQTSLPSQTPPTSAPIPRAHWSNAKGGWCFLIGATIGVAGTFAILMIQAGDEVHPYLSLWAINTLLAFAGTIFGSVGVTARARKEWEVWSGGSGGNRSGI